jgi:ATP-dependent protease ClpP protease subunit
MAITTLSIDGIIGWDVYASDIREQLASATAVEIQISSPGGDVAEGLAIFNAIRDHRRAGHQVTARIVGLAASMATYIPLAAERITAEDNAVWMIHNAWGFAAGDYRDMRKTGDILDGLTRTLARAYAERTGQDLNAIRQQMDDETWLFGEDIVAAGFADAIEPAGDGPEDSAEAFATARARFARMTGKLREREQPSIDKIAALLPLDTAAAAAQPTEPFMDPDTDKQAAALNPEPQTEQTAPADTPNQAAAIQAAITAERQRVAEITARCNQVGMPQLAQALIDSGADMAACNAAIVDAYVAKGGAEITQHTRHASDNSSAQASWQAAITKINARRAG